MNIAITGMGVISAAGGNVSETLGSFQGRRRNAGRVSLFPTDSQYPVFEVRNLPEKCQESGMRSLALTMSALEEALQDADLPNDLGAFRVGVCLGTTVASQLNDIDFYRLYRSNGTAPMDSVERFLKGNLAAVVARAVHGHGPAVTVVNACSSGTDAIGVALSWLRNGMCDIAVAGGADELNRVPFCGFGALGIVSQALCRPFDRDRDGLNLGEGAGILILETEPVARHRGKKTNLYLAGYGSAGDAYHLTAPRPDGSGLEAAIRRALADAHVTAREVCFVNAHGTATRDNDLVEASVLARVFGSGIGFLSTKGFTGHALGAAGGLEAVFTAVALGQGWIPASAGFEHRDEELPIAPVEELTPVAGHCAVSTSLAFGGNNSALVISRAADDGRSWG